MRWLCQAQPPATRGRQEDWEEQLDGDRKLFARRRHRDDGYENDGRSHGHSQNRGHAFDANALARFVASFHDARVFNHNRLLNADHAIGPFLVRGARQIKRAIWPIGQFFIG